MKEEFNLSEKISTTGGTNMRGTKVVKEKHVREFIRLVLIDKDINLDWKSAKRIRELAGGKLT